MERPRQIDCVFEDLSSLYLAYMPFIKGAGLFIRTDREFPLGTILSLSLTLLKERYPFVLEVKVVWITPVGAQGNKPLGLGLQFVSSNGPELSKLIENYLVGMKQSTQLTDTF